ncbi:MAG: HlyD family efflux transporter periplasmic adaptor subunit [Eubacteriales bacterium]|nr:HlyD family efflux transporter periplasmic adaptor subunit [Eubacteriales bacterium]
MKVKTIIAVTLSVCLVCSGAGYGIYSYMQNNKNPVEVTPVSYLSTQYYGDSSSISGTATSDVTQKVQLSGENNVKEVYVKAGDKVKVGDKLMSYDMTLTELDLEMEKLNKATLGLKMEAAQKALEKLYNTTPVPADTMAFVIPNERSVSLAMTEGMTETQGGADMGILDLNPESEVTPQTETEAISPESETERQTEPEQTDTPVTESEVVLPEIETESTDETQKETQTDSVQPPKESEYQLPEIEQDYVVPAEKLDYKSQADIGEGTKEEPFIFYCTENVLIHGSFLNLVRGWDEEGTEKIAGGAYVLLAVRAKDAADGVQRILRLNGNGDKRDQGYYKDSEWRFTPEGMEIIVDQEGNRTAEGEIPKRIETKEFEKMFADQKEEEESEQSEQLTEVQTESQTQLLESETQTETVTETAPETIPETIPETAPEEIQPGTEEFENQSEILSETEEPEQQSETMPVMTLEEEEKILNDMIIMENLTTQATEAESETGTEPESETESELWLDLATMPNAAPGKLLYDSIDKKEYFSGDGTKENPYLYVCAENTRITGGFLNRVMGFDKDGKNRDMAKACYVRLEIRQDKNGNTDYNGETVVRLTLNGTAQKTEGFNKNDIWIMKKTGLEKLTEPETEKPTESETEKPTEPGPGEDIDVYSELTYESLGDKNYKNGAYYKGDGTANNPFTFRCAEETKLTSTFINRVLGYNKTGEKRINDGVYVCLEIEDPQSLDGLIEKIVINGTQKHDPYPPTYSFLFTKNGLEKIIEEPTEPESDYWGDDFFPEDEFPGDGGGITYTEEELKAAIREQETLLKTLTLDEKESELKITQYEKKIKNGVILSSINGVVKAAGDASTGESNGDAFIEVTSDSGMYIVGNMSELNLGTLEVGDEVSVQSLETGMQYTAVITEISEYPEDSSNNYYGYGTENTNASYYPFKAYVEEADGLNDSSSVTISVSASASGLDTIYLQMAYIRSENGQSYVYKAGKDGKLKKQYVKTGKIIYSSYMEIKEGLTMEDSVAFPYGSDVKEGAKTVASESGGFY